MLPVFQLTKEKEQKRKKVKTPPPPGAALMAAALGAAGAAVQVRYYFHLCTKKSQEWVVVHTRFRPRGVGGTPRLG